MAKTNAQIQSDYRKRHLTKDKSRVQIILDTEVADQLAALRVHYGVPQQAVIDKLIQADWKRVTKQRSEKELKKLAASKPKRGPAKNVPSKAETR